MPSVGGLGTTLAQLSTSLAFLGIFAQELGTLRNDRRGMRDMDMIMDLLIMVEDMDDI